MVVLKRCSKLDAMLFLCMYVVVLVSYKARSGWLLMMHLLDAIILINEKGTIKGKRTKILP